MGFYGEDLFKVGPLNDLVADTIIMFSKELQGRYVVFVFGVGSDYTKDQNHPPLKELWEHFQPECRICFDQKEATIDKFRQIRESKLDVFISLPGYTGSGDAAQILYCRVAKVQMNWLEFASLLYDQDLVDFTIVGQAVGDEQRRCQTRERLALIDSPGTYQPVQSFALLEQVHLRPVKKDRAYSSAGFTVHYSARRAQQCSVTCSAHSEIQKNYFVHYYFRLIFHLCTTVHRSKRNQCTVEK